MDHNHCNHHSSIWKRIHLVTRQVEQHMNGTNMEWLTVYTSAQPITCDGRYYSLDLSVLPFIQHIKSNDIMLCTKSRKCTGIADANINVDRLPTAWSCTISSSATCTLLLMMRRLINLQIRLFLLALVLVFTQRLLYIILSLTRSHTMARDINRWWCMATLPCH